MKKDIETFQLRGKCPNTEFFLVRVILYLDWTLLTQCSTNIDIQYRKPQCHRFNIFLTCWVMALGRE